MSERIKILSVSGVVARICASLGGGLVLATSLAGCASQKPGAVSEETTSQENSENPVVIEIVPQYDTDSSKAIDTSHLPKKTIQTPWGPREIPDQSKNPGLIAAYQTMDRLGETSYSLPEYINAANLATRIRYIQNNDILRLGCAELRDSTCYFNGFLYADDCESKHKFGSSILSECEKTTVKPIMRTMIGYTSCELNDEIIHPREDLKKLETTKQQIAYQLQYECKIWRGEPGWDRAYVTSQIADPKNRRK